MPFSNLTPEEQNQVKAFVDELVRPTMGELARVNNHLAVIKTQYDGLIGALLTRLAGGDIIPNDSTGLDGTAALTKTELDTIVSYVNAILTTYNGTVQRGLFAKSAGPRNLIG